MTDYIERGPLDNEYHSHNCDMHLYYNTVWNKFLGYIKVTEHPIALKESTKPFKSVYRFEIAARNWKKFKFEKHLNAGIIEFDLSNWAVPVFLASRRTPNYAFALVDVSSTQRHCSKDTGFIASKIAAMYSAIHISSQRITHVCGTYMCTFGNKGN